MRVESYKALLEYWAQVKENNVFRIQYRPPLYDPDLCSDMLEHFSTVLFREGKSLTFAIDEAQRYRIGSARGDYPRAFYQLQDEGRHKGIATIQVVRRPVQTPPESRGLADECISFRLNSGNDIRILEDYFGDRAEEIRNLEKFHYMRYIGGEGVTIHRPVKG